MDLSWWVARSSATQRSPHLPPTPLLKAGGSAPLLQLGKGLGRGSETTLSEGTRRTGRETETQASDLGCLYLKQAWEMGPPYSTRYSSQKPRSHSLLSDFFSHFASHPVHQQARLGQPPLLVPPGHAQPGSSFPVQPHPAPFSAFCSLFPQSAARQPCLPLPGMPIQVFFTTGSFSFSRSQLRSCHLFKKAAHLMRLL